MKKNKIIFIVIILLISSRTLGWYFFENIQKIKPSENIIATETSPDSNYQVTAYLINNGATVGDAVLVRVADNNGFKKNIYWNYPCDSAKITWQSKDIVNINNVVIDVKGKAYDWRKQGNDIFMVNLLFSLFMILAFLVLLYDYIRNGNGVRRKK